MPFICVTESVCEGRVATWRDEDGRPVIYDTYKRAELDAIDAIQDDDDEADEVLEVIVTDDKIFDPVNGRVYWEKK